MAASSSSNTEAFNQQFLNRRRSPSIDGRSIDTSSSTTTPEASSVAVAREEVIPTSPQQAEIVRQLLEFMCAAEEGDPEAITLFAGLSAHRQLFNAAAECDEMLEGSIDGWLEMGGSPISVCVEGNGYYFQLSEDDLRKVFRRYGEVSIIEVIGPEKDVAHIYYKQLTDAQNAVQDLNDKMLNGVRGMLRVVWGLHQSPRTFPTRGSVKDRAKDDKMVAEEVTFGPPSPVTHWTAEALEEAEAGISRLLSEIKDAASPMKMANRGPTRPSDQALPQGPPSSGPQRNNAWRSLSPRDKGRKDERPVWSEEGAAPRRLVGLPDGKSRSPLKGTSPKGSGGGPIRKFTCRFDIGIDNDKEFQVARRIIGNKGANMKRIVNLSNAKLRLRGQGSGYLEGAIRQESPDPLHLCISCVGRDGYNAAVNETKTLLNKVYNEYRNYEINKGNKDPGIINIQMKEHFLTGPGERDIDMDYALPTTTAAINTNRDASAQPSSYPSSYNLPSGVPIREGPYNYPR